MSVLLSGVPQAGLFGLCIGTGLELIDSGSGYSGKRVVSAVAAAVAACVFANCLGVSALVGACLFAVSCGPNKTWSQRLGHAIIGGTLGFLVGSYIGVEGFASIADRFASIADRMVYVVHL